MPNDDQPRIIRQEKDSAIIGYHWNNGERSGASRGCVDADLVVVQIHLCLDASLVAGWLISEERGTPTQGFMAETGKPGGYRPRFRCGSAHPFRMTPRIHRAICNERIRELLVAASEFVCESIGFV